MSWIEPLINEYISFMKKNTVINENTGTDWISISTPLMDMHNDAIEIFALKESDEKIILSDDGITLKNLQDYGIEFNRSAKKKELLSQILLTYGISLSNNELQVIANSKNFPQKKFNLIQSIAEVNDLIVLSKPNIVTIFSEEVETFLKSKKIIFTPHFIAKGNSGLEFNFDFQIASIEKEILIKSFGNATKSNVVNFLYSWQDVREFRAKQSKKEVSGVAIINDTDKEPKKELIEALTNEGTKVFLWKNRFSEESLILLN
jgi:hypothetical protein